MALVNVDLDMGPWKPQAPDERTRLVPCLRPARWLMGIISVAEMKALYSVETKPMCNVPFGYWDIGGGTGIEK